MEDIEWDVRIKRNGRIGFRASDVGSFLSEWLGWERRQRAVPAPPPAAKLLSIEEFCREVGIGRTAVYALIKHDGFPAPKIPRVGRRVDLETGRNWLVAKGYKLNGKARKEARRARGR